MWENTGVTTRSANRANTKSPLLLLIQNKSSCYPVLLRSTVAIATLYQEKLQDPKLDKEVPKSDSLTLFCCLFLIILFTFSVQQRERWGVEREQMSEMQKRKKKRKRLPDGAVGNGKGSLVQARATASRGKYQSSGYLSSNFLHWQLKAAAFWVTKQPFYIQTHEKI